MAQRAGQYQWQLSGTSIPGATTSRLTITNVQPENAGAYLVYASNIYSFTSNGPVQLTVYTQPQITNCPAGTTATLSTLIAGPITPTFQWRFNGTNLGGATDFTLSVPNVEITDAGYYSVVVSVPGATSTSSSSFLGVISNPTRNPPGSVPAPTGLIDWWPLEGNFLDLCGTNNATPVGGVSIVPAVTGYGCYFDGGTSTYLAVGASPVPPPWTAAFWVNRFDAPAQGTNISASLIGDSQTGLKLEQWSGTRKVGITKFGIPGDDFVFNYTVPTNTWIHLVLVGTETNTSVYANGVLQDTMTDTIQLPRGQIGADLGGNVDHALGTYDEIMLFNRALDPLEIYALYNAGSAGVFRSADFSQSSISSGQFRSTIRGLTGKTISVYSSSNLVDWTFITSATNSTGLLQFTDALSNPKLQNFTRLPNSREQLASHFWCLTMAYLEICCIADLMPPQNPLSSEAKLAVIKPFTARQDANA